MKLASNGIKYHSPEQTPIKEINMANAGEYICLDLKMHEKKIYSLFKRLQNSVVGLFITKRIMENNQRWVEVEGQPGKGSILKLYFQKRTANNTHVG